VPKLNGPENGSCDVERVLVGVNTYEGGDGVDGIKREREPG